MSTTPFTPNAVQTSFAAAAASSFAKIVDDLVARYDAAVVTLYRLDKNKRLLMLLEQRGLPAGLLARVESIPVGKGMAGICAQRLEPVQVCNLQTDDSGVVRQGAKEAPVAGAISLPIKAAGELVGVLGVGKGSAYEFSPQDIRDLEQVAATIAGALV